MSDREQPELLKEQIRIKNAELKKLEGAVGKQEERIQYLLGTTQKHIRELQSKIEEQKEEVRYHKKLANELIRQKQDLEKKQKADAEESLSDEERLRFRRVLHSLQELKKQNEQLSLKLDSEQQERERLIQEKGLLAREIQRLRNKPDVQVDEKLKKRAEDLEKRMEEAQQRFDHLLQEKDALIASYEETLHEVSQDSNVAPATYKQVRRELETLKREKKKLENTLERERRIFKARLSRDIRFLEEQIERRLKLQMSRHKKKADVLAAIAEESFGEGWLTTYADMVTLLLTFFVLYYSIARANVDRIVNALGEYPDGGGMVSLLEQTTDNMTLEALAGLQPNTLKADLENIARKDQEQHGIEVTGQKNRILVQIPGEALFDSGSADLKLDTVKSMLEEIVEITKKYPAYKIRILGHTDDVPIATERFPTNWELSSARASAVLRYFLDKNVSPRRLSAAGYADTFPIASNRTEMGRQKNRRVEIVLEKEG